MPTATLEPHATSLVTLVITLGMLALVAVTVYVTVRDLLMWMRDANDGADYRAPVDLNEQWELEWHVGQAARLNLRDQGYGVRAAEAAAAAQVRQLQDLFTEHAWPRQWETFEFPWHHELDTYIEWSYLHGVRGG